VITDWSSILPTLAGPYNPADPNNICNAGNPQCVQSVAREMSKRLQPLSDSCSHNALFALLYLDVTNHIYTAVTTPGYFQVPGVISHEDALFASYYFNASDAYSSGDLVDTPYAWQVAFNAAATHSEQGIGNLLLGMNAHINRDLPFVLYASGLADSSGQSGKADYDKVEQWLNDDTAPLLAEAARRFDPTIDDTSNPLVNYLSFQAVSAWRETAWRNAELLAAAPTDAARAVVAQGIEAYANTVAQTMLAAFAVNPLLGRGNAARDAYCALHNGDTATTPYPMGTPAPYGNKVA
jgi:hypothetical protein